MAMLEFEYTAQRFCPRQGTDQPLLLFVAPAAEIRNWAGVPRKAFDYQHGFQRTLHPGRVSEVAQYFLEDVRNISPTSVVVGLMDSVKIEPIAGAPKGARVETVTVRVSIPDFSKQSIEELASDAVQILRTRIPADVVSAIDADVEAAVAEATKLQDEDVVDEEFGIEADIATSDDVENAERSYLADFYAQLLGQLKKHTPWPADQAVLREVLYSLLKPAIIVDGQHRVFGAATVDQEMLMAVCAIPAASWVESVYQFVVINQKAKPIKPAFLSSIIATSLSTEEIQSVYKRLRASKIDVHRAQVMDQINTDAASPFNGMIDFEVENTPGFLQFPGMTKLTFEFQNIPRSHPVLLAGGSWNGVEEGGWLDHFFALWRGVKQYFEAADPRLWERPSDANPNNLLKIVTLQEVQKLMLDNWADSRIFKLTKPAETEAQALKFWEGFPSTFFTDEWRLKGLQTSVGRSILRESITETRRNTGRKNWGHRRLRLFSD